MKKYGVKEVFGTLQGEGRNAGAPAVFLRFAGCNLGYEVCPWCDTDWVKAEHTASADGVMELVMDAALQAFGGVAPGLFLVATGGEPSLQFDRTLSDALRGRGFRVAMETNGSRAIDRTLVDWLTVSPKQEEFIQKDGDELKIIFTGNAGGIAPDVEAIRRLTQGTAFTHYYLQPLDSGDAGGSNYSGTIGAIMQLGPPWRLSAQLHKIAGIR